MADHRDGLTVRMRAEEAGELYVLSPDGQLRAAPYARDGSYIVFPLDNGGSFALARQESAGRARALWIAAAGIAAAAMVTVLMRKKRA